MHEDLTPEELEAAATASRRLPPGQVLRLAVAGLFVFAAVVFVLQNLDSVPVDFLSFSFDVPLILLLVIAAVAGVLFRWLFRSWRHRRNR
jgi:uncharacterized integral membrane protein